MDYSLEDFKKVIESESSLTRMGVNSLHTIRSYNKSSLDEAKEKLKFERESFLAHFNEFIICCEWLSIFKKVNTPQLSSYYLKHVVEKLACISISNGALIAAAIHLNIPIKYFSPSPNVNVAISKKCPCLKKAGIVV